MSQQFLIRLLSTLLSYKIKLCHLVSVYYHKGLLQKKIIGTTDLKPGVLNLFFLFKERNNENQQTYFMLNFHNSPYIMTT